MALRASQPIERLAPTSRRSQIGPPSSSPATSSNSLRLGKAIPTDQDYQGVFAVAGEKSCTHKLRILPIIYAVLRLS